MADNWTIVTLKDPHFIPNAEGQESLKSWFLQNSKAESIELVTYDSVQLFDCGANLEMIICPKCNAEIDELWWGEQMSDDYVGNGFQLSEFETPCCQSRLTLNDLNYHLDQGFGKFALEAMNPSIGKLSEDQIDQFSTYLKSPVKIIYRMI